LSDALEDALRFKAEHTEIPPLDIDDVLAHGRRRRSIRRRAATVAGVTGAAVVAVVAVASWLGGTGDAESTAEVDDEVAASPRGDPSLALYTQIGPYVTGRTLHVGDATVTLDPGLSGLYPTRIGAVVKLDSEDVDGASGAGGSRDAGGPGDAGGSGDGASIGSRVVFVGTDGETRELGTTGFDTVIGTDPATTFVAFSQPAQGARRSYDVVVVDVRDGSEVARTTFTGRPWAGWDTPATSLAGDTVYLQAQKGWLSWEFRAGDEVVPIGYEPGSEVAGGVLATGSLERPVRFIRLGDGEVLSTYDARHEEEWIELSHDGSHGIIYNVMAMPDWLVIDTTTGDVTTLPPVDSSLRAVTWAPTGDLVLWSGVEEHSDVRTCSPETGQCDQVDGVVLDDLEMWSSGQTAER
jgi:hypothetical protein